MKPIIPAPALAQHMAIVGKTGSGKTYAAKGIVEGLLDDGKRVCIIDPTGAWHGLRAGADGRPSGGFNVAIFGGEHGDIPIVASSGPALADVIGTRNLPAVIDLSEMLIGDRHRFMTDFAEALFRLNKQPMHLVIDEADEFAPQNPLPETKRMLHQIDRIVRRGRIKGFRVVFITQRPAVLHKNILTQANTLIAMRLIAPQDRKAIEAWIEGQGDEKVGEQVLQSLAGLPKGHGWVWAPEQGILEQVHFPKIRTFDSSRSPDDDKPAKAVKLAEVDVAKIQQAFEVEIQKAKENDPAALRKEIAELKKQLAQKPAAPAPNVEKVEVPVLKNGQLDKAISVQGKMQALAEQLATMGASLIAAINKIAKPQAAPPPRPQAPLPRPPVAPRPARPAAERPAASDTDMTGPEQRILDALAWLESIGVTGPEQTVVAFLAGYTAGGGAFNNPKGRLRSKGLIDYGSGGTMTLTAEGRTLAAQPAAVLTIEHLHQQVLDRLPGPEQKLLRPILAAYPNDMSNEELAEQSGYTAGAGAFNNPKGRLRSLGLIEYPSGGRVKARSILFLE